MSRRDQMMRGFRDGSAESANARLAHRAGIAIGLVAVMVVFGWG